MIHELGNISSTNEKGALRGCTKWKFSQEEGWGKGAIKKRITFEPRHLFFEERQLERFMRQIASSLEGGEWVNGRLLHWYLTKIFQIGLLRLRFWERLKLQLDQVLNLFGIMTF